MQKYALVIHPLAHPLKVVLNSLEPSCHGKPPPMDIILPDPQFSWTWTNRVQGLQDGSQVDPPRKQRLFHANLHQLHLKRHGGESPGQQREAGWLLLLALEGDEQTGDVLCRGLASWLERL